MSIDPKLRDQIYQSIAEELSRNEYEAGVMARAVAESDGNKEKARSLYIKFRYEQIGQNLIEEAKQRAETERQAEAATRAQIERVAEVERQAEAAREAQRAIKAKAYMEDLRRKGFVKDGGQELSAADKKKVRIHDACGCVAALGLLGGVIAAVCMSFFGDDMISGFAILICMAVATSAFVLGAIVQPD